MRLEITLHHALGSCTLFDGRSEECPPIPRRNDIINCFGQTYQVEGVQYVFIDTDRWEIQLLA